MAILPERLGYQPKLDIVPGPDAILLCCRVVGDEKAMRGYRLVHTATKL
jgi:hypothetical protein